MADYEDGTVVSSDAPIVQIALTGETETTDANPVAQVDAVAAISFSFSVSDLDQEQPQNVTDIPATVSEAKEPSLTDESALIPEAQVPQPRRSLRSIIQSKRLIIQSLAETLDIDAEGEAEAEAEVVSGDALNATTAEIDPAIPTPEKPMKKQKKIKGFSNLILRLISQKTREKANARVPERVVSEKKGAALTSNFATSFVVDDDSTISTHIADYALPSNLHLDFKPTLAGSNVLSRDFRNGLTGRRVVDSGIQNPNMSRPNIQRSLLAKSTNLSHNKGSNINLSAKSSVNDLCSSKGDLKGSFANLGSNVSLSIHNDSETLARKSTTQSGLNSSRGRRGSFVLSNDGKTISTPSGTTVSRRGSITLSQGPSQNVSRVGSLEDFSKKTSNDNLSTGAGGGINGRRKSDKNDVLRVLNFSNVMEETQSPMQSPVARMETGFGGDDESKTQKMNEWHAQNSHLVLQESEKPDEPVAMDTNPRRLMREFPERAPSAVIEGSGRLESELPLLQAESVIELEKQVLAAAAAVAEGKSATIELFSVQKSQFETQKPRQSFIPRPASTILHSRGRFEIVPLSLVENEGEDEIVDVEKEAAVSFDSEKHFLVEEQTVKFEPAELTNQTRPHTVPTEVLKGFKSKQRRQCQSAKVNTNTKTSYPPIKHQLKNKMVTETEGKRITILTRDGFGTGVQQSKLTSGQDPVTALLSTHNTPRQIVQHTNTNSKTHPGPVLPVLSSRPITALLRNKIRDPQALDPDLHMQTRQFNADSSISSYSQPLPITRYIPNSQKLPSKHTSKLRDLRAQHESKLQEEYFGGYTAIAPKWFKRHAGQVVTQTVQQGLLFGGAVQGLAPTHNGQVPCHRVYESLGKVHWQEYDREGSAGDTEVRAGSARKTSSEMAAEFFKAQVTGGLGNEGEQQVGETRRMLDDLLKRSGIRILQSAVDAAGVGKGRRPLVVVLNSAVAHNNHPHEQSVQATRNIGLMNVNLKEEKKVSLGGGFIYTKNKAPKSDTTGNDVEKKRVELSVKAVKKRYLESLVVEAFSV